MNRRFRSAFLRVSISYIIFVSLDQSFANLEHNFKEANIDTEESLGKQYKVFEPHWQILP